MVGRYRYKASRLASSVACGSVASVVLPRGKRVFMNLHLASGFPNHEVGYIGMRFLLSIREHKLYRLASVLLYGRVAIEEQGQFALLKGFTLDCFICFAGDRVT